MFPHKINNKQKKNKEKFFLILKKHKAQFYFRKLYSIASLARISAKSQKLFLNTGISFKLIFWRISNHG